MGKKSGYSKMYMIPPSVWELVKRYINNLDMQRLEQLNAERESQIIVTPGDRILSNISSQDINPIDASFRSRSELGDPDETRTQELMTESYTVDPSMHESDRSRSTLNPDSDYINISTQSTYPTQETLQELDMAERAKMIEGPKTVITRPRYATAEYNIQDFPIVPSTALATINRPSILKRVRKPQSVTFKKPLPVSFKKPLALTFKEPLIYKRKKRSESQYIEPMNLSDKFLQTPEFTSVDYENPYMSQSFGRMPAPELSISRKTTPELSTTLNDPDVSRISFDPKIYSTPIRGHKLPTIVEEQESSPIPIPILPLPSCAPSTSKGVKDKSPRKTASSYAMQTRSRATALAKPYNLRSKTPKEGSGEIFKCNVCNATFKKQNSLESHYRVVHNINKKAITFDRWKV